MFSHIMVGVNDMDASRKFYDALMGTLGIATGRMDEKGRVFYVTKTGVFAITKPINGEPACAANGGTIVGEEYFPLDHADYRATVEKIMASGTEVVFNMTVPPGVAPFGGL